MKADRVDGTMRALPRMQDQPIVALLTPLAVFGASRALQLVVLLWQLPPGEPGLRRYLQVWDGRLLLEVARLGYSPDPTPLFQLPAARMAFFPLYPALVRGVVSVTGAPYDFAGLAVTTVAGAVASVLLYRLGVDLYGSRTGIAFVALFATQPLSIVLSLPYTEALFAALVAGMLLAIRRQSWLIAGGCCLAAGLTRPTGLAAAAALVAAAAVTLWRGRRSRPANPPQDPTVGVAAGATTPTPRPWRPVLGAALGAVAVPGYVLWVGLQMGRLDGWFHLQRTIWNTRFDGGQATVRIVEAVLRTDTSWPGVTLALMVILAVGLTVVAISERVWWPLLGYGIGMIVMTLGSDGLFGVKSRYLVPALVTLIPVAAALGKTRPRTVALVLAVYALIGTWYGARLLFIGGHPI